MPRLLIWILTYGAGGFFIGFLFGALRELVLVPAFGQRMAHGIEFPLVTGAVMALGFWIGRRTAPPALAIGLGGVAILIALESALALGVLGQSPEAYLASYDITRGALFPYGLMLMAIAPALGRRR